MCKFSNRMESPDSSLLVTTHATDRRHLARGCMDTWHLAKQSIAVHFLLQINLFLRYIFMKNFIPGRRRIFGYGFKGVVGPLKTKSRAQQDESSLEVLRRLNKIAFKVPPKCPS